jgi:hypothetical protein
VNQEMQQAKAQTAQVSILQVKQNMQQATAQA